MERLSTGERALDLIVGGGVPRGSVAIFMGEPGAGKTLVALQMLFHHARHGRKCLYFTTLSEPALKLLGYMREFAFFDESLLSDTVTFVDLGTTLRERGADAASAEIVRRVEECEPALVVIDSFKALADCGGDSTRCRLLAYDLAVRLSAWGTTTLLIGEYVDAEIAVRPEFAIADGIVRLLSERRGLTAVREVDVLKLRGLRIIPGRHFLDIGPTGVTFYPRVGVPEPTEQAAVSLADRCPTGVAGLDSALGGGLPRHSATVVQGGTGTGKTLLGLHFLIEGAARGEPGVLFTLEEGADQLRGIASGFDWKLDELERAGTLRIEYTSPVELSTDIFLHRARRLVQEVGARRAVLDSLTTMALGAPSERRFQELAYALTRHFRAAHVSLLMTLELAELLGAPQLSAHGVSFAADNLIQLRYVEAASRLERGITVLKARGIQHPIDVRRMTIDRHGISIGEPYEHPLPVHGVRPIPPASPLR